MNYTVSYLLKMSTLNSYLIPTAFRHGYAPGAGASVEDCGMVSMQGADPDRPKVNQAGKDSQSSAVSHTSPVHGGLGILGAFSPPAG